jgi:translation elongation factor EF-G
MAKQERTNYQKKVISRYYENLDTISLTKLQELVTELYLAETPAQKDKLWLRVEKAMLKMKVSPAIAGHLMEKKDVRLLAQNLNDWFKNAK